MIENDVDQKLSKQRSYESKIMQFMAKTEKQLSKSVEPTSLIRKNTLQDKLKQKDKYKEKDKVTTNSNSKEQQTIKTQTSIKNNKTKQSFQRKALRSKQPSTLRRKTTLITSHHNLSLLDNNPQQQPPSHQQLLQKIQTKISLINQKISQSITKQQNQLLNEYETKLREKQQLLNRLKRTTNPQMIKQKTMERKEQLKREKESLIEGNMYYHERMESVKGELDWLLGSRQAGKHTLRMLVSGEGIGHNERLDGNGKMRSQVGNERITKQQKPEYLKNNHTQNNNHNHQFQFVQKVLSTYNQTKLFNQQQQQHNQKSSQSVIADNKSIYNNNNNKNNNITHKNNNNNNKNNNNNITYKQSQLNKSCLPRISQQQYNRNISSVVLENKQSFDNDSNDFYSYRKVKNRFERVRSINVMTNGQGSIIGIGDGKLSLKMNNNSNKDKQKESSNTKVRGQRKAQLFGNNINKNEQSISITCNDNKSKNNMLYKKQYLQQFVVKKLTNHNNRQIQQSKQVNRQKDKKQQQQQKNIINVIDNKNNTKHKQLIQHLQNKINNLQEQQLTIQRLFKTTTSQYYNYKQRLRKGDLQQKKVMMVNMNNNNNNNNNTQAIDDGLEEEQYHQGEMTLLQKIQLLEMGNQIVDKNKVKDNKNAKSLIQLQTNEFDKRTVIDLLFSQLQFKQYLYKLIVEQFITNDHQLQGMKRQQYDSVQSIMDRFDQHRLL